MLEYADHGCEFPGLLSEGGGTGGDGISPQSSLNRYEGMRRRRGYGHLTPPNQGGNRGGNSLTRYGFVCYNDY